MLKNTKFKPTRLYVKQHSKTGLLYFGKTTSLLIESYKGSGKLWKRHIDKHGHEYVRTIWVSEWYTLDQEVKEFALAFSELFDIVKSPKWANLKEEDGLTGGFGDFTWLGKKKPSQSTKMLGSNNPMFGTKRPKHVIHSMQSNRPLQPANYIECYCILCRKRDNPHNLKKYHGINKKQCITKDEYVKLYNVA